MKGTLSGERGYANRPRWRPFNGDQPPPLSAERSTALNPLLDPVALIGDRPEGAGEWPLAAACGHAVAHTGKQLRPRLVLEASRLGTPADDDLAKAMRAVELLHVATLSHDDVVDATPLRRGARSVDDQFGAFAAEYAGGWMLGRALELAAELPEPALTQFSQAVCELCEGEMLETQELRNPARSEESYLAAIQGKTASLFRVAALLGGTLAGVDARSLDALGEYGHWLGMAFQLADDLADLLADSAATGKPRGGDVRQGVYTLPVVYALERDPELAGELRDEMDDADVDAIVDRIARTGAFERSLSLCADFRERAARAASELDAPALADFLDAALSGLDPIGADAAQR